MADEVVSERPGIRAYEGHRVIAAIRPENMEDASIMPVIPEDRRMKVDIVLREALGPRYWCTSRSMRPRS